MKQPIDLASDGRGASLWSDVTSVYALRTDERELLAEACRLADLVDTLRNLVNEEGILTDSGSLHPALVELRQVRTQLRLHLNSLALPDEHEEETPASIKARKAANARWRNHGARSGR